MPRYQVNINCQVHEIEAPEDMPLLWVLRDMLKLTGTKYGCGMAQCRACTVHIDGSPTFSCVTPISSLEGAQVVTIEGLPDADKNPLLDAWVAEDVPQCGYCQPGQIMSAAALLRKTPKPSDVDIDAAMSPNLCRCGTYVRIRRAIHRAAGDTP